MIPKIIHYCWFGKGKIPKSLQVCISSWKTVLYDYQFVEWNEDSFDIKSTAWTKQAYEQGKYAFVSDYVRLKALFEIGGIYLDTDVKVLKSFDVFLNEKAFMGFENNTLISSAVMGAEKGFPLIEEFLHWYDGRSYISNEGNNNKEANVVMMSKICQKHGLLLNNQEQFVENMHVFPKTYFCPLDFYKNKDFSNNTYTIHYFNASWLENDEKRRIYLERTKIYKGFIGAKSIISKIYHKIKLG